MSIFTEPVLSACTVLYKTGMCVLHAVQCFQESDIDLELHVVDNSPNIILKEHLLWQCPGAQYYAQKKNLGFAGASNIVIPQLQSQYHLVCHPDVTFDDKLLSDMVNYMEHNKGCVILSPRVLNKDGAEQYLPKRAPGIRYLLGSALQKCPGPFKRWHAEYTLCEDEIRTPTSVEVAHSCFLLIRTSAIRHLNGFDPRYFYTHADSDLSRRAMELGAIVYHPEMVVVHNKEVRSKNLPELLKRFANSVRYLNQWGWRW